MPRPILAGALLLLAACGSKSFSNDANVAGPQRHVDASNDESASNSAAKDPERGAMGRLPPADSALRFVGTWATSQAHCGSKPWRFTADELRATDGPQCRIYKVNKVPGGYDLAVQCPAKKPVPTDLIKLRFAESARAILLESNAIAPIGLVYCGK